MSYKVIQRTEKGKQFYVILNEKGHVVNDIQFKKEPAAHKYLDRLKALFGV